MSQGGVPVQCDKRMCILKEEIYKIFPDCAHVRKAACHTRFSFEPRPGREYFGSACAAHMSVCRRGAHRICTLSDSHRMHVLGLAGTDSWKRGMRDVRYMRCALRHMCAFRGSIKRSAAQMFEDMLHPAGYARACESMRARNGHQEAAPPP